MADEFTNEYNPDDVLRPEWTADGHVDEGTIHTWLDGAFDEASAALVQAHVDRCATCRAAVAEARGFVAGASRVARALDAVPSDVVPEQDVARVASRIVAAASMPSTSTPVAAAPSASRRAWYRSPMWQAAAALLITVGGGAIVLRDQGTPEVANSVARAKEADANAEANAEAKSDVNADAIAPASAPAAAAAAAQPSVATENRVRADELTRAPLAARKAAPAPVAAPAQVPTADAAVPTTPERSARAAEAKKSEVAAAAGSARRLSETVAAPPAATTPPVAPSAPPAAVRDEDKRVTGEVVTRDGKPLEGASVIVVGTTIGSTTDSRGRFSIVPPTDSGTVLVRRLGFESARVPLSRAKRDSTVLRVPLKESLNTLSAVVVTSDPALSGRVAGMASASVSASAPGNSPSCWRVVVSGDAASLRAPIYLQLPVLVAASTVDVRWLGWPRTGVARTVRMLFDAAGGLSGRDAIEGMSLQLTFTRTTDGWSGRAIGQDGPTRRDGLVELTGVPDAMCKP